MTSTPSSESAPVHYLALGDSYTIGEAVAESERWPVQLAARLAGAGVETEPVRIIAKTGWTTDELQAAIQEAAIGDTFDLVSLLIGVNNQYRGYPVADYETEFEALLQTAIAFAGGDTTRVFVLSIPDYGVTPFAASRDPEKIGREIDAYNAINQRISAEQGVAWFDITPISRQAATDTSLVAADGLHPSGRMYRLWVDKVYTPVLERLRP